MTESNLVRDVFNPTVVKQLAAGIKQVYPAFEQQAFATGIIDQLGELSYSERITLITDTLEQYLPDDVEQSINILIDCLPPEIEATGEPGFRGFIIVTLTRYVSRNGLDHFDLSMNALYEMTKRFTAEWDIRPFIKKYPNKVLSLLDKWATDDNMHVRRLVSEGTRSRLPWGMRLHQFIEDPMPVIALLDQLKDDPELYVRRSVANNLNDIAKDNPQVVIDTLKRWQKGASAGTKWVIKHATRTLIKDGHNEALELLGFDPKVKVTVSPLDVKHAKLKVGDVQEFSFSITSNEKKPARVVIDYCVYYMKANGSLAPKVYKIKELSLKRGEQLSFTQKRSFKPITTRVFHAGKHAVSVKVNGTEYSRTAFELKV